MEGFKKSFEHEGAEVVIVAVVKRSRQLDDPRTTIQLDCSVLGEQISSAYFHEDFSEEDIMGKILDFEKQCKEVVEYKPKKSLAMKLKEHGYT